MPFDQVRSRKLIEMPEMDDGTERSRIGSQQQQRQPPQQPMQPMQPVQPAPTAAPTFSQLQQQGQPRPAPPGSMPVSYMAPQTATTAAVAQQPPMPPPAAPAAAPANQVQQTLFNQAFAPQPGVTPYDPAGHRAKLEAESQRAGGTSTFSGQTQAVQAPQWQPGQNPFQTPQAVGGFQAPNNPVGGLTQDAVRQALQNPSAYNSDAVLETFKRLSGGIDDDYAMRRTKTDEEMARRGIYDSTIAGGRLHDLNIGQRSARTELAGQMLTDQARQFGSDRAQALAAAMGFDSQQFGQAMGGYQANLAGQGQNFGQSLQGAQFNQGQRQQDFGNQMASADFQSGQNQQGFQNELARYDANLQGDAQGFNQRNAVLGQMLGLDQQNFQNQLAAGGFNQGQQQQSLQNYLGFGQQQFQNQTTTAQLNDAREREQMQLLMQLFGGT